MNYRLRIIVVAVLLAGLAGGGARPAAALPARQAGATGLTTPAELETFLDGVAAAQMAGLHVAGMTVAVVKNGAPFFAKGYGYADLAARTPVDAGRTLFRAGSVSKLLVWTAVMQMVEQGQLDLDADIATYVDLPFPVTYPEPITLRHLMTHTPGFEDKGDGLFVRSAEQVHPLPEYLAGNIPARIFPPGETQAYSNYGAALAAHIVERVSGRDFNDYVEQNILQPLGMAHTTFRQPLPPELAPDLSRGYRFAGGAYEEGIFEWVQPYPAGSMSTTAADMAIFMITHLQNGRYGDARILEEATAREMHTARQRSDPRLGGWGLGFNVGEMNGVTTIGHGGDTNWFHSNLTLLPDHNVGIFVSTNTNTGAEARSELVQAFMDRYFPAVANPPASPDLGDPAAYSGTYFPARMNVSTVEKILALVQPVKVNATPDGKLAVSGLLGAGTTKWIAGEPGVFAAERDDLPARSLLIFGPAPGGASGAPRASTLGRRSTCGSPGTRRRASSTRLWGWPSCSSWGRCWRCPSARPRVAATT